MNSCNDILNILLILFQLEECLTLIGSAQKWKKLFLKLQEALILQGFSLHAEDGT
jgi:hypothetical protein